MSIVTGNTKTKTLSNALARIETLEAENRHLIRILKERNIAGYINPKKQFFEQPKIGMFDLSPVYYISDEYDAAGILITPEVKIEQ